MTDYLGDLRLFTVAEGAEVLGKTEDWYMKRLRSRQLPGRKAGRDWKVNRADIEAAIELMAKPAVVAHIDPAGLSAGSRRRHAARRRRTA